MIQKKNDTHTERDLFDLVEGIGEILLGDLHIIDANLFDQWADEEDKQTFRVYHGDGYCIDVIKEAEYDEEGNFVKYDYSFCEHWDEFKKIGTAANAIELIKKSQMK